MIRALHRVSRIACPPRDRRWVDAMFAEMDQIDSPWDRLLWLLGTVGLVLNRNAVRLASAVSPVSLLLLLATAIFSAMAAVEYEGLAFEDDWYGVIAALFGAGLVAMSVRNLRHRTREPGL